MDSILISIKKLLGLSEDYEEFDPDVITAINTAFFALWQLGVGPKDQPFKIESEEEVWTDFVEDGKIEMCKSYVGLQTRILFDPPTNSFLVDAINEQLRQQEFRMIVGMDEYAAKEEA